jgi:NAD-reducing hydrogenase small subunit
VSKLRLATVWLDGCSGCHMSLLDMDERLIDLADKVDLVYSPLVDTKIFPEDVDITLVEGAVSSEEDLHKIETVRARSKTLISLGDCAVTANVPSMRNPFGVKAVCDRAYRENVTLDAGLPDQEIPALLDRVRPVHEVVAVDLFVPGCPPAADVIFYVLTELLEGRTPKLSAKTRFGA